MAIDLANIKTQFKSILDTANTTTASPDLSGSLNKRVQKVLKLHPAKVPVQPSYMPYVTCYFESKTIEHATIAKNQRAAKRKADGLTLKVVGAIFDNRVTSNLQDDSDIEIEQLMENIEDVLRDNHTLNSAVDWSHPTSIVYAFDAVDERTIMRVGVMDLKITTFY